MRKYVETEVQKIIDTYKVDIKRVTSDYRREVDDQRSYHGRELLELLQNADDQMEGATLPKVKIQFDGITLTVSNNGTPFDKDGVSSLMLSNISPKRSNRKQIGNMGTGFRSILGWAKEILIHSYDLHIKFSEEHSQRILNEIIPDCKKRGLVAATLVFPEWVNDCSSTEYTTQISLITTGNDKVKTDIINQMNSLTGEILLFLNNTNELELDFEGKTTRFIRKQVNNSVVLEKYEDDVCISSEEWYLKKAENKEFEKQFYSVVLAYNLSDNTEYNKVLYCYFPTKVEFPYNVLLHADFALNNNRNGLRKSEANKAILETAANLLVDMALELFGDTVSYNPIEFLISEDTLPLELKEYQFEEMLIKAIGNAKIFPTINHEYVKFNKKLKFYTGHLAEYVSGQEFGDLMIFSTDDRYDQLIAKVFDEHSLSSLYENEELENAINSWVISLPKTDESLLKITGCLAALIKDADCYLINWHNDLNLELNVLFDENYNLIPFGYPSIAKGDNVDAFEVPHFMDTRILHPVMEQAFKSDETLREKMSCFNICDFVFSDLVSAANKLVEESNSIDYCIEELRWVWNHQNLWEMETIDIILPTRSGELTASSSLFMGKEYNNEVEERIISCVTSDAFVSDIKSYLSISNSEAKSFLKKLGVSRFPRIVKNRVSCLGWCDEDEKFHSIQRSKYTYELLNGIEYPLSKDGICFNTPKELQNRLYSIYVNVSDINGLEDILKKCSTKDIMYWIKHDDALKKVLFDKYEDGINTLSIRWYSNLNRPLGDRIVEAKAITPIYWLFSCIPWIDVDGNKYCIGDCLLDLNEKVNLSPCLVRPAIEEYIQDLPGKTKKNKDECISLLSNLGIRDSFGDLNAEKIYETLLFISEVPDSGSIAKKFYNELLELETRKNLLSYLHTHDVKEYKEFISHGKVFCRNGEYVPVKKAYFVSKKGICSSLLESMNVIAIQGREAYSALPELFGIKQLQIKGLSLYESKLNSEHEAFERDFEKYKPLAFTYRVNAKKSKQDVKTQARKFANLSVVLCSEVVVEYDDRLFSLSEGDFYYEAPNTYYLCYPYEFNAENKDIKISIAISSIICSHLDLADDNKSDFQWLYSANTFTDRMTILYDSFDNDTIQKAKRYMNSNEDLRDDFIRIIDSLSEKEIDTCQRLIDDIDFDNIFAYYNCEKIRKLFRKLNIELDDFNSKSDYQLDFRPYYRKKVEDLLPGYRSYYKNTKYHSLLESSIDDKMTLQSEFIRFQTIQNTLSYRNSVYFDYDKEIVKQLSIDTKLELIDFDSLFNDNRSEFISRLSDSSFVDVFLSVTENASLLYFGEYDALTSRYNDYVAGLAQDPDDDHIPSPKETKPVKYVSIKAHPVTSKKEPEKSASRQHYKSTGYKSSNNTTKYGRDGERYVYYDLINDNTKSSVRWVSENAQKENVNPEGAAYYGYDLEYVNEDGVKIYVEVKSTTASLSDGIGFHLSSSEYEFGQNHSENYLIYYVSEIKGNPTITIFNDLFVDGEFNSNKYSKKPDSYLVQAEAEITDEAFDESDGEQMIT